MPAVIADLNEDRAQEIAKLLDLKVAMLETRYAGKVRLVPRPIRFTRQAQAVVWDSLIATATGEGYRIDLLNPTERLVSQIRVPIARRPVTQAMRESIIQGDLDRLNRPQRERPVDPEEDKQIAREAPFADSLPPYQNAFVTRGMTLWVVDAIAPGDDGWSATAFRKDGGIVGRLRAPGPAVPLAFENDRVLVRTEDQNGVVSLKVYRMVPRK